MQRFFRPARITTIFVFMAVIVSIYLTALYNLQINKSANSATAALPPEAAVSYVNVAAERGDILDRNGVLLISSRPEYNVTISRSALLAGSDPNGTILNLVSAAINNGITYTDTFPVTKGEPFAYLSDMSDTQKSRFETYIKHFKLDANISAPDLIKWMRSHYSINDSVSMADARLIIGIRYELESRVLANISSYVVFAEDVGVDFIAKIKEQNFTGVNVETSTAREYHTKYAAQILGYVGLMNDKEYQQYGSQGYAMNAVVGKSGVEKAFEQYLHGSDGTEAVSTEPDGTVVNVTDKKAAVPGENVYLTLDIGMQAVAENSLAKTISGINETRDEAQKVTGGAVVVTDVHSGDVLASASYPTYDLSTLMSNYTQLANDKSQPLFNRATQGSYNPGSTFKMVTALAGLRAGVITPWSTITDKGIYTAYKDYQPKCWIYAETGTTHGTINVMQALEESCNYFFYTVGDKLGIDKIEDTAKEFGFGQTTGIEIPDDTGTLGTPDYKLAKINDKWYASDTLMTAIGQDYNLFTPVQMANYVATIANGGTRYSLTLLKDVKSADFSSTVYTNEPKQVGKIDDSQGYISVLHKGMEAVASKGTASSLFGKYPVKIACKTGTVQLGTAYNNGVFVCYAPADDPQIAVAVVVEKGGSGAGIMDVAKDVLDYYFSDSSDIGVAQDNALLH